MTKKKAPSHITSGEGLGMNNIIVSKKQHTMSTREIAELTGKGHRNVMRDTHSMLVELYGNEGMLKFEHTFSNAQNHQNYREYWLPKRETLILVSGYSLAMRVKIIDRWQELESQVLALPDFNDPVAAARAWADAKEGEQKAIAQYEKAQPALRFVENFVERKTLMNATQLAETHGMSAINFNRLLDKMGGVYNKTITRGRTFCHAFIDKGYGEMKVTENGYTQALFTPSGAEFIARKLVSEGVK